MITSCDCDRVILVVLVKQDDGAADDRDRHGVRAPDQSSVQHVAPAPTRELCGGATGHQVRGGRRPGPEDPGHRGTRRALGHRRAQEELQQEERVGQSLVRGPHHPGHQLGAGEEADAVADLRMDGAERSLLQGQGRQQQLCRMEGNTLMLSDRRYIIP